MSEQGSKSNVVAVKATVTDLDDARRARSSSARKESNRRFDHVKVARLKAEIAAGTYVINPHRVADKFIEHERNAQ